MKIGFVLDDSLDSSDGVQQYVLTLGEWLGKQGHEVHYLVGQTQRSDFGGIHSLSRNVSVRFNGNRMTIPLPANRRAIKKLLTAEKFDILHVQMPYSPFMAARVIMAAPKSTTIVGTFHILPLGKLHTAGAKALQLSLRRSQGRISKIWSVSRPAQIFAASLGVQSGVLPNVVDLARFKPKKPIQTSDNKQSYQIVFLGRLVERKGCLQLLKAVKILVASGSIQELHVKIGGKGPQLAKLQRYVATHNLTEYVDFTGYVAEADKAQFLATADVAVFPSLGGESFGIVLLEAMAAGSGIVLAGHNAGYSSVLEPVAKTYSQTLFDPLQPAQLAGIIKELYSSPNLAEELHKKQQLLVKSFDVNLIGQKLLLYYQQAINQKPKQ